MSLLPSIIDLIEPRTVMTVGCCIAIGTSGFLAIQAAMSKGYRSMLIVFSVSMLLAGISLGTGVAMFDDFSYRYTFFSISAGLMSYLLGMYSIVTLYRPSFPKAIFVIAACIAFSGFAFWTAGTAARNWNTICQFTFLMGALCVVLRARDELAPSTRWLTISLCIFAALGFLPRLLILLDTGIDQGLGPIPLNTTSFRIRALIWTLSPIALYAVVTGVIHARIGAKLKRAVDLDVLTGAHSRRYLFEKGDELLTSTKTERSSGLSVLLIDIDHFKQVNDQWGHSIGDDVLKHLVHQIKEVIRLTDSVIARYGGEEFVVLMPTHSQEIANKLGEGIRSHLKANPFKAPDVQLPLTVSIGVAVNRSLETLDSLINRADECLYRAKKAGRDQVVYQSDLLVPV